MDLINLILEFSKLISWSILWIHSLIPTKSAVWIYLASLQEAKQEFVDGLGTWVVKNGTTWHPSPVNHPSKKPGWKSMGNPMESFRLGIHILGNPPQVLGWYTATVWRWKFSGRYIMCKIINPYGCWNGGSSIMSMNSWWSNIDWNTFSLHESWISSKI